MTIQASVYQAVATAEKGGELQTFPVMLNIKRKPAVREKKFSGDLEELIEIVQEQAQALQTETALEKKTIKERYRQAVPDGEELSDGQIPATKNDQKLALHQTVLRDLKRISPHSDRLAHNPDCFQFLRTVYEGLKQGKNAVRHYRFGVNI